MNEIQFVQSLMDEGLSFQEMERRHGRYRKWYYRIATRHNLESYVAFDEIERAKEEAAINFEWLWEEDVLDDVCRDAFIDGAGYLPYGDSDAIAVSKYVASEYGGVGGYLEQKDLLPLADMLLVWCAGCGCYVPLVDFFNHSTALYNFGLDVNCRECTYRRQRKWRLSNPEKVLAHSERWRKGNPEKHREILRTAYHRRLARKKLLPDTLTKEQLGDVLNYFDHSCALTDSKKYEIDHVIPLSIGHGGSVLGNVAPLRKDLNISKLNRNIFEWFDASKYRLKLSQQKFDFLIDYLAEVNEMTGEEYREYVYWCHDNPRTIDQLKEVK